MQTPRPQAQQFCFSRSGVEPNNQHLYKPPRGSWGPRVQEMTQHGNSSHSACSSASPFAGVASAGALTQSLGRETSRISVHISFTFHRQKRPRERTGNRNNKFNSHEPICKCKVIIAKLNIGKKTKNKNWVVRQVEICMLIRLQTCWSKDTFIPL